MIGSPDRPAEPGGNGRDAGIARRPVALGLDRLLQIVLTAAVAGLLAGLMLTGLQRIAVVPMIFEAEIYETAAGGHEHGHGEAAAETGLTAHTHENEQAHEHAATAPAADADGGDANRFWLTLAANLVSAAGFGLLLAAGMNLLAAIGRRIDWRKGLLWGLAGFGAFQLAPALGLPPELPGAAAAELGARQGWWLLTVLLTGAGLAWAAFAPRHWLKLLAVVPIVIPHLIGAPAPERHGGLAPESLATGFIYASLITNLAFWLGLGALTGYAHAWFERRGAAARA
jgi:cobalt transporter subunit CbtA